jgi:hypothetical protein
MVGQGMVLILFVVIEFVEFAGFVCSLFYEVSVAVDGCRCGNFCLI